MDKFSELKAVERFDADIEGNGGEPFAVWVTAINGSHVFAKDYDALLAELGREQGMRAQNLEIKTLVAEKVKGLETKLWDSQQLVDAKSSSQIELRSQISSLEESNRKDMAWRGERLCELEDSLEAAQRRIAELEAKLATPVQLPTPSSALDLNEFAAEWRDCGIAESATALREQGFTVEGDA